MAIIRLTNCKNALISLNMKYKANVQLQFSRPALALPTWIHLNTFSMCILAITLMKRPDPAWGPRGSLQADESHHSSSTWPLHRAWSLFTERRNNERPLSQTMAALTKRPITAASFAKLCGPGELRCPALKPFVSRPLYSTREAQSCKSPPGYRCSTWCRSHTFRSASSVIKKRNERRVGCCVKFSAACSWNNNQCRVSLPVSSVYLSAPSDTCNHDSFHLVWVINGFWSPAPHKA